MSDYSLILVLQSKTSKIIYDMANINIKSHKPTPFGVFFHVMEKIDRNNDPVIDGEQGQKDLLVANRQSECKDADF